MKKGFLSEYFSETAFKKLSAVEASTHRSNQHEFDGIGGLKKILGNERKTYRAKFIYLNDENSESVVDDGFLTWYDAREKHPTRSEYRLYFPDTKVTQQAEENDLLVIGKRPDDSLTVIIAKANSTAENQIIWLFGIEDSKSKTFSFRYESDADKIKLKFSSRFILESIGIEIEDTDEQWLEYMLTQFQGKFPTTRIFSDFARSTVKEITPFDNPDDVIVSWMEREELLFRTLEKHLIKDRLNQGFTDNVDEFISFSLSVQNRRKSRAGSALENHLEYLFSQREIKHSRTACTEAKAKPDFLFPGKTEYHDPNYSSLLLTMLGVKSSCKDRWRQIVTEANRIEIKHLFTLEPGISEHQTEEMIAQKIQLVLPQGLHESYSTKQRNWLINLNNFIDIVESRQQNLR